jgi:hypothetical protein
VGCKYRRCVFPYVSRESLLLKILNLKELRRSKFRLHFAPALTSSSAPALAPSSPNLGACRCGAEFSAHRRRARRRLPFSAWAFAPCTFARMGVSASSPTHSRPGAEGATHTHTNTHTHTHAHAHTRTITLYKIISKVAHKQNGDQPESRVTVQVQTQFFRYYSVREAN